MVSLKRKLLALCFLCPFHPAGKGNNWSGILNPQVNGMLLMMAKPTCQPWCPGDLLESCNYCSGPPTYPPLYCYLKEKQRPVLLKPVCLGVSVCSGLAICLTWKPRLKGAEFDKFYITYSKSSAGLNLLKTILHIVTHVPIWLWPTFKTSSAPPQ